jgi:hypothetical protein
LPDGERPVIRKRVLAWRFAPGSGEEQAAVAAVQRAADFIRIHSALFPAAMRAGSATAAAVLAVKTYELFQDTARVPGTGESPLQAAQRVIDAARAFDRGAG